MTYSVGYFIISQKTHSSECVSRNDDISTMYMENGGGGGGLRGLMLDDHSYFPWMGRS